MLGSGRVVLRARRRSDVPAFLELNSDPHHWPLTQVGPFQPETLESAYARYDALTHTPETTRFSAEVDGELAGYGTVWGIDTHNRSAHLGLGLLPAFRGQGLGADLLRALCGYCFVDLGLHRVAVETLATNTAMIRTAESVGFVAEGTLRQSAWVRGQYVDERLFGLLAQDWA